MPTRIPALLLILAALPLSAQDVEDCLMCHDDTELTKIRGERVISLFVDEDRYHASVHGREEMTCIDCHADLDGLEDEHAEELEPVDCTMCHDDTAEIYAMSLHGRLVDEGHPHAPQCWDCHGAHEILPPTEDESRVNRFNIPLMCGGCHKEGAPAARFYDIPQDSILTHYEQSIHGEGLFRRGLTISAVCTDCHTAHSVLDHEDPASTIHRDNIAGTCQMCHGRIEQVHQKVIAGELWEKEPHNVPVCIECHQPHEVRRVFYDEGLSDRECLVCHGREDLAVATEDGEGRPLFVHRGAANDSAHRNVTCIQCHTGATPSLDRACSTVAPQVDCSICHADQVAQHAGSTHGRLAERGDVDAPRCLDCHADPEHGPHGVKKKDDPAAPTYVSNIAGLCAECHGAGEKADVRHEGEVEGMVENYAESVHGRAVQESGLVVSATCVDCHTAHAVLPQSDPTSSIHRANIVETCAVCHEGIFETFKTSIHFTGDESHGHELPMCDDCHSSHQITETDAGGFMAEVVGTCGRCHEEVTESYFETFHGKVVKLGYTAAAKCQDCHGAHDILPTSNPASTLSRENIVETCGQCHEGSHRRFAGYLTHATHHDKDKYPFIHYTWLFMTILLVGTFTFFGFHTLAWLPRSIQAMRHSRQLRSDSEASHELQFRRFGRLERYLHVLVIVSFISLAITGMTIKFSYLGWAQTISHALGGFQATGVIHRMAAVVTFFYFFRHVAELFRKKRKAGVSWREYLVHPDSMLPNKRDGKEFVQTVKWFFYMGERPRYGRWTYWEKFDYFAVFWGVAMIGFSGLMLWFPEAFTRIFPGKFINIATIIHSDEALLATGFIFTVHFFNTHFRPDRFPMDPVIFTGRMSLEEFKEDRPREYEEMVASGRLEEHMVEPMNPRMVKAFRIFGFSALTVGLALILLIIWTVVFGYR